MSVQQPPPTAPNKSMNIRLSRLTWSFARRWVHIAIVALGIYSMLPILTPALMAVGLTAPARVLYTVYAPFCHQFAFRSLFIFGEQVAYPRAIAGSSLTPYEVFVVNDPDFLASYDFYYRRSNQGQGAPQPTVESLSTTFTPWMQFASKDFLGNDEMGYKMTLCARDVAIYVTMFVGAILYSIPVVRLRLRPCPLWLYLILGIAPIGIDGFSQLLGYPPFNLWEPRETLPIYRVVTGALFGIMNVWLAFPYLEESMRETRQSIEAKFARAGISLS
jgi:uncharacterized membrane protein